DRRVADVGVDLHARHLADRHGVETPGEVIHVGGDDEPPAGDLVTHQLDRELFPLRDALHLGGGGALAGQVLLGPAIHNRLPSPVLAGSGSKGVISARPAMRRAPLSLLNLIGSDIVAKLTGRCRSPVRAARAAWAGCSAPQRRGASPIPSGTRTDRGPRRGRARGCRRDGRSRAAATRPSGPRAAW